jgi:hypothetical protein
VVELNTKDMCDCKIVSVSCRNDFLISWSRVGCQERKPLSYSQLNMLRNLNLENEYKASFFPLYNMFHVESKTKETFVAFSNNENTES